MQYTPNVWGQVVRPPEGEAGLLSIRVEPSAHGSFHVLLREEGGEFDIWIESEDQLIEYLNSMQIVWPAQSPA